MSEENTNPLYDKETMEAIAIAAATDPADDAPPVIPHNRKGPTFHTIVAEDRLEEMTGQLLQRSWEQFSDMRQDVAEQITKALRHGYLAGLQDGFAQGCVAEAESHVKQVASDG